MQGRVAVWMLLSAFFFALVVMSEFDAHRFVDSFVSLGHMVLAAVTR